MHSMTGHPSGWPPGELLSQCQCVRQRRSGPGGQHRNKVETAVVLSHLPTGIRGEASERRSQDENRRRALFRLRLNLALGLRCPRDLEAAEPSALWRRRCVGGRLAVAATHDDLPALLAEALDVLEACDADLPRAAGWLGCTASQLIRFLKTVPRAFAEVNARRRAAGRRPLR
jgi:hypothetical protein